MDVSILKQQVSEAELGLVMQVMIIGDTQGVHKPTSLFPLLLLKANR